MTDAIDSIAVSPPFNLALGRGERLELIASSRKQGRRRIVMKRSCSGRVRVEQLEPHSMRCVIELDAKGETARLVTPGPIHEIDTKVSVELVLEAVIQSMRGALLDDGGMLYPPNVD